MFVYLQRWTNVMIRFVDMRLKNCVNVLIQTIMKWNIKDLPTFQLVTFIICENQKYTNAADTIMKRPNLNQVLLVNVENLSLMASQATFELIPSIKVI